MTPDRGIEELVRTGELGEAAARLAGAGEHARAAALYERACEFASASEQALLAGDGARAMRLAVLSGDDQVCRRAAAWLLAQADRERVTRVAAELADRGYHRHAADLFRGAGALEEAAGAYERAGLAAEAAACFEQAEQPAHAARALESALRTGRGADADRLRAMLGKLYERHGKHEAAIRVLQQIASESPERAGVLAALARALEALGLTQARRELDAELARHGVSPGDEPADAGPSARGAGALLHGRYRVEREVADAPHARLYQAKDTLTGERVAVKVFHARSHGTGRDALARFVREARALARLRHPNVVPLHDFVPEGPSMVLAWMGGGSLRELLDRETLSPARAAEIAGAVLGALAEAHRLGILHRDVKPSNLLFDEGGTARLADFGAAHLAESEATVTAGEIGTVLYMAPEQRMGRPASLQSDIYSVGVLLYEMLTGALRPRLAEEPMALASAHPDLGPPHQALLDRFLAPAPSDRFASALEARAALEALAWPARVVERARVERSLPEPEPSEEGGRLGPPAHPQAAPAIRHDRWLERDVLVVPLDEASLARAAAFARADHPALGTVLRADPEGGCIWVEAPLGEPLSRGGSLSTADARRLREALAALHRAGGVHGAVDADHVHRHAATVTLAFPLSPREGADAESDVAALEALLGRVEMVSGRGLG